MALEPTTECPRVVHERDLGVDIYSCSECRAWLTQEHLLEMASRALEALEESGVLAASTTCRSCNSELEYALSFGVQVKDVHMTLRAVQPDS